MIVHKAGFIVVIVLFISVTLITSCYQVEENNWENAIRAVEYEENDVNQSYDDAISFFLNIQFELDSTYKKRFLDGEKHKEIDSAFQCFIAQVDGKACFDRLRSVPLQSKEDSLLVSFLAMKKLRYFKSDENFVWLGNIVKDWHQPQHGIEYRYAYILWLAWQQSRFYNKGLFDYTVTGSGAALHLLGDSEIFEETKIELYISILYSLAADDISMEGKGLLKKIRDYFHTHRDKLSQNQLNRYRLYLLAVDRSESTAKEFESVIEKDSSLNYFYVSLAYNAQDVNQSIAYLERYLSLMQNADCNDQVFLAKTYLIENYLKLNKIVAAKKQMQDLQNYLNCEFYFGIHKLFYNRTKSSFLSAQYDMNQDKDIVVQIDSILKSNKDWVEGEFVKYQSLHMADFYSGNTESQLLNKIKQQQLDYNSVTQLIYNTRHVNLKKALSEKKNPDYELDSLYSALHTIERKLAPDFNKGNFNNPLFLEQWHLAGQLINRIGDETEQQEVKALDDWRVDLKSIQKKLGNETNLVTYLKGEQYYWELTIAKDQIHLDTISVDIDEQLDAYNPRNNNTDITLLQQEFLTHVDGQEVIIMPDGLLTEFPFDIILGKGQWYSTHTDLRSFTEDEALTLSGEITLLSYTDDNTIGIGKKTIRELPFGFEECQVIADMLPQSKLITGHALDRHKLVESMESEILHLSTHGNTESYNRMANYLVVRDNNGKPTKVYVDEISQLDKAPILVNLSACSTAGGKHHLGEGTYSIARSFIQAGSETVIKTLWPVQEDITKEFMIQLYRHWLTGVTIGEAMMRTKASFQSQADRPTTDWAGYVLEGNTQLKLQQQ